MALSRDEILAAKKTFVTRSVDVPELGGKVIVKELSGKELDAYQSSLVQMRGKEAVPNTTNLRAKLVVRSLVDEDGKRLLTDQDTNALGDLPGRVLNRLYDVAAELSGISEEESEELAGKSEPDPSDDSTSTSPESSDAPSPSYSTESLPVS